MNEFPVPELLQREYVDVIGSVPICVEPIAESPVVNETLGPVVHLRMVPEIRDYFVRDDLENMGINPHQVNELFDFFTQHMSTLLAKYLPSHDKDHEAQLTCEHCFIDQDGKVIVTMFLRGEYPLFGEEHCQRQRVARSLMTCGQC